jgi:hypothetical protein
LWREGPEALATRRNTVLTIIMSDALAAENLTMTTAGTIEFKHGGTTYSAAYAVRHGQVHVLTPLGKVPPRPVGTFRPEEVAKAMLREILHHRTKL